MNHKQRDSRFMREGHFGGLKFDDGWFFYQVVGTEYAELKPYILLNENGNRAAIAAETAGSEQEEIDDTFDNKIIEPDDDERNAIFQILYGVAPSRMQVFLQFGRDRNVSLQDYDQPGDPAAYLNGFDSPYNNPSPQSEVFYINDMSPIRVQAYNPMNVAEEARVSFHVNKMRYVAITDRGLMKAMLQGQQPANLAMAGLGIQNSDQVGIPTWLNEAFGEHIHTTQEILDANTSGGQAGPVQRSAAELSQAQRGSQ